jgi:flagellar biosynthesis/type III secretory pathway protein FliH
MLLSWNEIKDRAIAFSKEWESETSAIAKATRESLEKARLEGIEQGKQEGIQVGLEQGK